MLDWVAGAVESAKTMKEIGQSLLTIRDENIIRERVYALNTNLMDLQQKLLEAHLSQMDLVQQIQMLKDEQERSNLATNLKAQYKLHTFPTSHHAYVLRAEQPGEPTYYFCSLCFETQSLVVTMQGSDILVCQSCKNCIRTVPFPQTPTRRPRFR
ncbi:hypothetical protein [Pseudomonas juntendi]|uniref:Uncharacterized protein n=1 Tax=Pseudomonas juntendi TaxID=2666183 RepID=A0AAJ5S065_9PSED|nr:hypothetical protein [Pseudomonas juntendi]WEA18921.1 hypothetical protein PWA60_16635 [Pseudomonas juntendi]